MAGRYSQRLRSNVSRLSTDIGATRPRTAQSVGLRTRSNGTRTQATTRLAGNRFGLSSNVRLGANATIRSRGTGGRGTGVGLGTRTGTETAQPGKQTATRTGANNQRGGRRGGGERDGYNWGSGNQRRHGYGHYHRHHNNYWLGYGLWCGFGYYGSYYDDYWYHHYRYHPYRFMYWWCPDYYYYQIPVFAYPPDSLAGYSETQLEPQDTEKKSARPVGEEAPTIESIIANHIKLGDFYFREGKYDKAAESYLRALAYAPEDASIHFILADALFGMEDYHYAAFIINKALRLDPEMAKAKADKREFYRDPKEFEKQLETLRKYITEKPYDSAAYLVLGYNLYFSGKQGLAKNAFARVLAISPDNQAAKLFLGALDELERKAESDKKPDDGPSTKPTSKPADKPVKKN